jgi:hypothetical protein
MRPNGRARHAAGVLLLLLLLAGLALAGPASAAPSDETLDLTQLRLLLEGGPLDGHMKTAMSGYAVEQIPVTVHALVDDAWGCLVLFEATGPQIERIGGIAMGMSGSPVYVEYGDGPKLVGAVSYGDAFTLGGMGLATPIEYMMALQARFMTTPAALAGTYELDEPVETAEGPVEEVVVASSARDAERLSAAPGEAVMMPLGLIEIGGLRPQSDAYRTLAAAFEKTGLSVRPGSGPGVWDGPPAPDLEPGSPCVALYSTGSVWYGASGTVTYVDGDTALLFGHPLWWVGPTQAALHAGYVSGVWPSLYAPYKLTAPRDEKGTVVQDRYWGVAARLDQAPDMAPIMTHATYPDEGVEVTDHSSVSQWMLSQPWYVEAAPYITMYALTVANDVEYYAGSAETTTRVAVSDATGSYLVERSNVWDTGDDVAFEASSDVYWILWTLCNDPDGVLEPHIDSIELDASISAQRRSGRFAGVVLPKGLMTGDNPIVVQYYRHGSAALQQVEGTLTLPRGVSRVGSLYVTPAGWYEEGDDWDGTDVSPPRTLTELVDELNESTPNSDVVVTYEPWFSDDAVTVQTTLATPCIFRDELYAETARVRLSADRSIVPYGGDVRLSGSVEGVAGDVTFDILRLDAGATEETFVKTVTAVSSGGEAFFTTSVRGLTRNTRLIARLRPTGEYLASNGVVAVKVRAAVGLGAEVLPGSAKLTVRVKPAAATGRVLLERYRDGRWVLIRSAARAAGETVTFRVYRGTHVLRARFVDGDICANGTSRTITVKVK